MERARPMSVTVRLDGESLRALRALEASGLSTSAAVRRGLVRAARDLRSRDALLAEVAALAADADDRREMLATASFMEDARAPR